MSCVSSPAVHSSCLLDVTSQRSFRLSELSPLGSNSRTRYIKEGSEDRGARVANASRR